jgi:hypothetical protein
MTSTEIVVIAAATVAGPVLAVQAQKWIERFTERKRARRTIFHALMSNRATRLNDDFVKALNLIDLEFSPTRFSRRNDRAVIDAWRALFGEYGQGTHDLGDQATIRAWNQRVDDRLVALLHAMSKAVGYDFSEEQLRRGIYYPKGRMDLEESQLAIVRGLRQLFEGRTAIPMKITEIPSSPELATAQLAMMQKSAQSYGDDGALKVRMVDTDAPQKRGA